MRLVRKVMSHSSSAASNYARASASCVARATTHQAALDCWKPCASFLLRCDRLAGSSLWGCVVIPDCAFLSRSAVLNGRCFRSSGGGRRRRRRRRRRQQHPIHQRTKPNFKTCLGRIGEFAGKLSRFQASAGNRPIIYDESTTLMTKNRPKNQAVVEGLGRQQPLKQSKTC